MVLRGQCNVREHAARAEIEGGMATQRSAAQRRKLGLYTIANTRYKATRQTDRVAESIRYDLPSPHRDSGDAVQKIGMPIVVRDVHYSDCGSGSVSARVKGPVLCQDPHCNPASPSVTLRIR